MYIPWYSTFTLLTELGISAIVYYSLYQGYKHTKFPQKLAAFALLYETLFNISYMASRVPHHVTERKFDSPFLIGLAIVHGILSLIMFIALVVFFIVAWKKYRRGNNFFKEHKLMTLFFTIFWTFSIVSGVLFYFVEYIF